MGEISNPWLAAMERGEVSLAEAAIGDGHGFTPPSATPYLDMARDADDLALWLYGGLEIAEELAGARPVMKLGRLLDAGLDRGLLGQLLGAGDLYEARVALSRDGRMFQIGGPDGRLLLALRDDAGAVVDALALTFADERQWARLTGEADILGEWHLVQGRREINVYATPLDWLRGGGGLPSLRSTAEGRTSGAVGQTGPGVCVLDPVWGTRRLQGLGEGVTLRVPAGQGARLKAQLERGGLPLVAEDLPAGAKLSLAERLGRGGLGGLASSSAAIGGGMAHG